MKLHAKKILNYVKNLWNEILQLFCVYFMKLDFLKILLVKYCFLATKVCHKLNTMK